MITSVPRRIRFCLGFSLVLAALAACGGDRPVAPVVGSPLLAKGGPSGNPTVSSTTPAKAPQNITVNVSVAGSGFDQGSRAYWAIDGDTTFAKTKVRTNSTTYVSARQLIASISIAADAPVDLYDVQVVTLSGRKGIGIELFAVVGLVDLGPASDSSSSGANDINAAGTVVGSTIDSVYYYGPEHATKWSPAGGTWVATDLTTKLGDPRWSAAYAVNAGGDIVGSMSDASGRYPGFLLSAAGVVTELGYLPGLTGTGPSHINTVGEVAGWASDPTDTRGESYRPFYWAPATGIVALPTLGGIVAVTSHALGINDNGIVVGDSWDSARSMWQAVRWERVGSAWTVARLASPAGAIARSINNRGDVVGSACVGPAPCQVHAVMWPAGGPLVDIGTLGGTKSEGYGVNSAGVVVGSSLTKVGYQRAISWTLSGGIKDIGALGGDRVTASAVAINDFGVVVGFSQSFLDGVTRGPYHGTLWR